MRFSWRSFEDLSARDIHDVLRLRQDVFVIEQACLFADIDGRDPLALHLLARDAADVLAGTLRLLPPQVGNGQARIGRVAIAQAARGAGLGRAVMIEGIAEAERRFGAVPIGIDAQSRLERFYASLGFSRRGEDYIEDGIPHCAMVRRSTPPEP